MKTFNMVRVAWAMISCAFLALAVTAQQTGMPSRPQIQALRAGSVSAVTPLGAGEIALGNTASSFNPLHICANGQAAGSRCYGVRIGGGGDFQLDVASDAGVPGSAALDIGRSGAAVSTINIGNATDNPTFAFLGTGAISANSVDMTPTTGSITATFDDACTTSPTATIVYYKIGKVVTFRVTGTSGFTCTGDSTNFATTGAPIPAALRPTTGNPKSPQFDGFTDNATAAFGCYTYGAGGNFSIAKGTATGCAGAWTAAGTRSLSSGATFSWTTD
jgi:hypothetical protein